MLLDQVDQEREGGQIDRALMKNVLVLFVEIRLGRIVDYEKDFQEDDLLKDSASCYSWKALNWIFDDSCPNYMLKVKKIFLNMQFMINMDGI